MAQTVTMVCPRCGREKEVPSAWAEGLKCGDCLAGAARIVAMVRADSPEAADRVAMRLAYFRGEL